MKQPKIKRRIENIFSVKNSQNKKHKIVKFLGLKFKFGRKKYKKQYLIRDENNNLILDQEKYAHEIYGMNIRPNTSDFPVLGHVFDNDTYSCVHAENISTIIDAGANIGAASVYFARKYPDAKIIAIEPDPDNYNILLKNVRPYKNITPVNAGLWGNDGNLEVFNKTNGNWGIQTRTSQDNETNSIKGFTIKTIMEKYNLDKIDILKMDIEGAEKDVFLNENNLMLDKIRILSIELHDRMVKNCSTVLFSVMSKHPEFSLDYIYTENLVFRKQ